MDLISIIKKKNVKLLLTKYGSVEHFLKLKKPHFAFCVWRSIASSKEINISKYKSMNLKRINSLFFCHVAHSLKLSLVRLQPQQRLHAYMSKYKFIEFANRLIYILIMYRYPVIIYIKIIYIKFFSKCYIRKQKSHARNHEVMPFDISLE